jgi:hypothetical protein
VTPITSAPVPAASAATTELSTPPDMATTIRASRGAAKLKINGHGDARIRGLYSKFTLSG